MDRCLIVAEIGHNHQGDIATAERMVRLAASCGVDAVKAQKRDNANLYTKNFYNQPYNSENAYGKTYGAHRQTLEFGFSEFLYLKDVAKDAGVEFFATAFDIPSVDFCMNVGLPKIKIASGDLDNLPLLRYAGATGVPLLLSTGGGTLEEIERALDAIDHDDVVIMQCTASYPCKYEELDLSVISTLRKWAPDMTIGASLHDNGIAMAPVAYALGARVIEKHVTLDRTMKGTDHPFSLEPQGLRKMVRDIRRVEVALGDGKKKSYLSEQEPLRKMRKAIYAARPLPAGHVLTEDDLIIRSPADGISPALWDEVIGKPLQRSLDQEEPLDRTCIAISLTA